MNRIPTLFVFFLTVVSGAMAQRGNSARRADAVPARLAAAGSARPKEILGTCTPALGKAAPVARPNAYRGGVPTNNDCAGAILLSVGSTCAPILGSTLGATQSLAAITCNTFVGDADDDVWYRFTATATALTVRVDGSTEFDAVVDVRSGTCNGTTIGCADATVEDGIEQVSLTGLTVGTSYLVRVYDYFLGAPATPDFTICVFGTPPPPPNDQCFNLVGQPLAVGGSLTFTGTTAGATTTGDAQAGSDLDDGIPKVWHRFTTSACANVTVSYCGITPAFDQVYIALANACPANTFVPGQFDFTTCTDGNATLTFPQLPAGSYYLPVGQFGGSSSGPYSISVDATACDPPPANDECANATPLVVGTTCQAVTGDVANATQSLAGILCNGFTGTANDDVWFSFVATATALTIEVAGSDSLDAVVDLRTGSCGNSINLACADVVFEGGTEVIQATGLIVGQTYYVRVYHYYVDAPATTTFDICVFGGAAPPANDNCANVNPVPLAVGGSVPFSGTTVGATAAGDALPGSPMDDGVPKVWHAFTLSDCADVTLSYCGTTPVFDQGYIVWTTCPADTFFAGTFDFTTCSDGNLTIVFPGLQPGVYWIPVGLFGSGSSGPYTITANAAVCAGAPLNDDCINAEQLTVWPVADCPQNGTQGNNTQATQDGGDPLCDSTTGSYLDTWYVFGSGDNSMITVNFANVNMGDAVVVITEGCGGAEVSCAIAPAIPYDIMVAPNTEYVVRIYSNTQFGGGGDFEICLSGAINTSAAEGAAEAWSVFPNPTTGSISLVWPGAPGQAFAELIDATGRKVWGARVALATGANEVLGISGKPASGTYLLRIITNRGITGQRVVVD